MTEYYFLASILPPLALGEIPEMSFQEFSHLLDINLTARDHAKVEVVRRFYDIENIRAFWKKEEMDPRGNLDQIELEEALLAQEGFPEYVYDFKDSYENPASRLEHFPGLLAAYFNHEIPKAEGFLKDYLIFERGWRLVLAAFRAKQLGRDLAVELQFENPNDDLVAQLLAQKDSQTFIPPDGYEDLQPLFAKYGNAPLELYQALCEYRFHKIESMLELDMFSIDRILGYMAELITAEKWVELNKEKGKEIAEKALKRRG